PMGKIDHVVVLMLENRSFNCLMGYLYDDQNKPKHFVTSPDTKNPVFNGVADKELYNFDNNGNKINVHKAPYETQLDMTFPNPDPGEEYDHVMTQMNKGKNADGKKMMGFVQDYIDAMQTADGWMEEKNPTIEEYSRILGCYPPEATPVLSGLARDFAVSDEWHCSVPSQTFCNRSFFHSASSHGFVTNSDYVKWINNDQKTIYNLLSENNIDWRVYWDIQDVFGSLTRLIHPPLYSKRYDSNFRSYGHDYRAEEDPAQDRFRKDCAVGDLPAYTFIEPRLFFNHNDMHPPVFSNTMIDSSILAGEELVNKVYEDLFIHGKKKDSTLLIITFDEHGGCYDHVYPPKTVPPVKNPTYPLQENFQFDQMGVRVPTLMISPWIKKGTVFRSTEPGKALEHTSVIKTVCDWQKKLNGKHLTDRDLYSPDFAAVLNAKEKRSEMPIYIAREYVPAPEPHAGLSLKAKFQRLLISWIVGLIMRIPPEDAAEVGCILRFIISVVKWFLRLIFPKKMSYLSNLQKGILDFILKS
ncbi:MAG: hypothetical protein HQK84_12675, partial [Nitrospinae bacterium]|nr:hypothetical protein [Nitrospinota bacterium]